MAKDITASSVQRIEKRLVSLYQAMEKAWRQTRRGTVTHQRLDRALKYVENANREIEALKRGEPTRENDAPPPP